MTDSSGRARLNPRVSKLGVLGVETTKARSLVIREACSGKVRWTWTFSKLALVGCSLSRLTHT